VNDDPGRRTCWRSCISDADDNPSEYVGDDDHGSWWGENTASGDFQNLLNALEEFTGVKLAIVSFSQTLDGLQDGCFILVVEELVQVPGPVEGLGIDH